MRAVLLLFSRSGVELGSDYKVVLPRGGVIAHPPGAGKTRIIAALLATTAESHAPCAGYRITFLFAR